MALWNFASICLPYCLEKNDKGEWIALNREYKPLGFKTRDWVEYAQYPISIKWKKLQKLRSKLHAGNCEKENLIFLYNDACAPWLSKKDMAEYMERLSLLAVQKIDDVFSQHIPGQGSYRKLINKWKYINLHIEKYGNHCYYCGLEMDLSFTKGYRREWPTIDHIEPLALGGDEHEDNYLVCCMYCNISKGKKTFEDFRYYIEEKRGTRGHKFYCETLT